MPTINTTVENETPNHVVTIPENGSITVEVLLPQTPIVIENFSQAGFTIQVPDGVEAALIAKAAAQLAALQAAASADEAEIAADGAEADKQATAGLLTLAQGEASTATTKANEAAGYAASAEEDAEEAEEARQYAMEWANKDEDLLVSTAAGGDAVDDYSAKHHSTKAAGSASTASTDAANASISASDAAISMGTAVAAAADTVGYANTALGAKTDAETAATVATTQAGIATTAATNAGNAKISAEFAAQLAEGHEQLAQMYADYAAATNLKYVYVTENYTAQSRQGVIADTSGGPFTLTLPATPAQGDQVVIADADDWALNPLIVNRNGSTIEDYADDLVMDLGNIYVFLLYTGTTWRIYAQAIRVSSVIDGGLY